MVDITLEKVPKTEELSLEEMTLWYTTNKRLNCRRFVRTSTNTCRRSQY